MARVLVNLFHPNLGASRGNAAMIDALKGLDSVHINDAYAHYGDSIKIDVAREKELLENHDILVFQHPLYWYSGPVLMKAWMEQAIERGWAYPPGIGTALQGKIWMHGVTASGPKNSYSWQGYNHNSISDYLLPYKGTANLCGAIWKKPYAIHSVLPSGQEKSWSGAPNITGSELEAAAMAYLDWVRLAVWSFEESGNNQASAI
ncbi:MAG: NAD(P)H-dependent oxidoreductase [Rhodospirillaceae bacterium]|nr:NAD(P)H-dependent oxidoreductase [Rhodospirillaceae bacterium]